MYFITYEFVSIYEKKREGERERERRIRYGIWTKASRT